MNRLALALVTLASVLATACASSPGDDSSEEPSSEDALTKKANAEWFYDGPLPALSDANVTVSLKGHTVRVTGYAPASTKVSDWPQVRATPEGGRLKLDVVYPIATAGPGKSNSPPGVYHFELAKPYRPDGSAVTVEEGVHFVPWGGYPFIAYNGGIAFHGPITSQANPNLPEGNVWYLQRGPVSGGCNRMNAEHVIELTHIIGLSMRKLYDANKVYNPRSSAAVNVISDYDQLDGKYVDVDYPTWSGATRPGTIYGPENVVMFGSWMATETPDGSDLPASQKWEGGVSGKYYVFAEHARQNVVCSVEKVDLPMLKTFANASANHGELPVGFCAQKDCILGALRSHTDPKSCAGGGGRTLASP
jgi:hypothetical protein